MSRFIVEVVDPGCGCCSYVAIAGYDRMEDIPLEYRTSDYSIYDQGEGDE